MKLINIIKGLGWKRAGWLLAIQVLIILVMYRIQVIF